MDSEEYGLLYLFLFILRIVIIIYCVNRARKLNRNVWGWGIFGFLLPIVALIWIQFMKPMLFWDKNPDLHSSETYVNNTKPKTSDFYSKEFIFWIGLILITIGVILLIDGFIPRIDFGDLWPIVLLVIGVGIIFRRNKFK
jgi:hypothetical protein